MSASCFIELKSCYMKLRVNTDFSFEIFYCLAYMIKPRESIGNFISVFLRKNVQIVIRISTSLHCCCKLHSCRRHHCLNEPEPPRFHICPEFLVFIAWQRVKLHIDAEKRDLIATYLHLPADKKRFSPKFASLKDPIIAQCLVRVFERR